MSKELAKTYDPKQIEEKLYERWCENKYFQAEVDRSKKPFTTVMPPPNITGKLHILLSTAMFSQGIPHVRVLSCRFPLL